MKLEPFRNSRSSLPCGRGSETHLLNRGRKRAAARIVSVFLGANAVFAQQPPVIRGGTKVVLVDVVVTDKKGSSLQGLTAKDFRIWEDGKEQTIQSLSLEGVAEGVSGSASARTNSTVLVLDYGGMTIPDQSRARTAALKFIDANSRPNHPMAVANLYRNVVLVVQSFTEDATRLKEAVNTARADPPNASGGGGRRGGTASADPALRNPYLALKQLTDLAVRLGQVPGRKSIVLLTKSLIVPNSQKSVLAELVDACNRSSIVMYPVDVQDSFMSGSPDASSDAGLTRGGGGRRAGRGGGTGDETDAPSSDPDADNLQFLLGMAGGTGGFLIRNSGELSDGIQKIAEEQDLHYVLGYRPPEAKDATCHSLRVKVERPTAVVRARSSYCPEESHDLEAFNAAGKSLEKRGASGQTPSIGASMQLSFVYASAGVARVHAALEIQPGAIKLEKKKDGLHADVNVVGIASSKDGGPGARFSDAMRVDVAEADFEKWKQTPLRLEKQFQVAPGEYTVTLLFSSGGDSFGKLEQRLVIEPYRPGQFTLSGLTLSKEARKAGGADQLSSGSLFEERTPLVSSGIEVIPAGSVAFAKSDRIFCYFEVYGSPAGNASAVTLRILNAKTGQPAGAAVSKVDLTPVGKNTIPVGLMLTTAQLAPGAYRVEASASEGATTTLRTAAFEIKPDPSR